MHVKFNTNLGSVDAERLGLDFQSCLAGSSVDVPPDAAALLIDRGIAAPVVKAVPAPPIQAVPPSDDGGSESLADAPAAEPKKHAKTKKR